MTTKEIKSELIKLSLSALVGAIGVTLIWLFSDLPTFVLSFLSSIPQNMLAKIFIGLCILLLVLIVWIYILIQRSKLQPAYGILWDKKGNPYCPSCKTILSNYYAGEGSFGFKCVTCKQNIHLSSDSGDDISLIKAREFLINRNLIPESVLKRKPRKES